MSKRDLCIIGGGAGGLSITSGAAQLGLKVTLIERQSNLGGDCLHYGCVPSKTFIHAANVAHAMRHADKLGLSAASPEINLERINQHVANVIEKIQAHDDPDRFRSYGAEVVFGEAVFTDPHTLRINGQDIKAKRFVLAMGSSPAVPPIPGLDKVSYLTNETIFQLKTLPKNLVVLGGGVIGLEMAQAFSRLGSQVVIVEMLENLLPQLDQELVSLLQQQLEQEGIKFYLGHKVVAVMEDKTIVAQTKAGEKVQLTADELLVATGRSANVKNLNLDKAGVVFTQQGFAVDDRLRTNKKHIYAVGDVVQGPYKFTHMAEYHAGIVIANVAFRLPKKVDERVIPAVVFTEPEFATVGLTETLARQQYKNIDVMRFELKDVDRAITDVNIAGLVKVIAHKNKIIGAHVFAAHGGELLAELALAMQAKIKLGQISATIHAYPTLAQVNRRVVNSYFGEKLFSPKAKAVVKWINKIIP